MHEIVLMPRRLLEEPADPSSRFGEVACAGQRPPREGAAEPRENSTGDRALSQVAAPPGRMQRLGGGDKPLVVIDYAHTPDALRQALMALRPAVGGAGELICVFGCGGDRDPGKRPEMGRVAAEFADRVIVTSDNPRGEDPAAIAEAIFHGIRDAGGLRWALELDRATAIRAAVASARSGDVVLVAGKGHEDYQERNGVRTAFSDAAAAAAELARRGE